MVSSQSQVSSSILFVPRSFSFAFIRSSEFPTNFQGRTRKQASHCSSMYSISLTPSLSSDSRLFEHHSSRLLLTRIFLIPGLQERKQEAMRVMEEGRSRHQALHPPRPRIQHSMSEAVLDTRSGDASSPTSLVEKRLFLKQQARQRAGLAGENTEPVSTI